MMRQFWLFAVSAFLIGVLALLMVSNPSELVLIGGFVLELALFLVAFANAQGARWEISSALDNWRYDRRRRREWKRQERKRLRGELRELIVGTRRLASGLPDNVVNAAHALDRAEREFKERAFAPFWAQIENAARSLSKYLASIQDIEAAAVRYRKDRPRAGWLLPRLRAKFRYVDPRSQLERLETLTRIAQKDFQFATIFEQRTTNRLLREGFGGLSDRIDDLGGRFENAIESMGGRIVDAIEAASETQEQASMQIGKRIEVGFHTLGQAIENAESERSARDSEQALRTSAESEHRRHFETEVSKTLHDIHDDVHRRP
jgi:hypothetical protein